MYTTLNDMHGRTASYMRISVTDRCNLRCSYCAGEGGRFISHPDILRYEEILDLMDLGLKLGIKKVRFTGGEPFVRSGFGDFMVEAASRFPDLELCMTTNATLIENEVDKLAGAGLKRINISLDTFDREKYERITGRDLFDVVLANIFRCLDTGMDVKVNAVAMKGVNDNEMEEFVRFAVERPLDMRFIEFMPVGTETGWNDSAVWPAADILAKARELAALSPSDGKDASRQGPAKMYNIHKGKGRIGIISPYTNHFCATCNRLRVTANGNLRTCLFSDKTYRLRSAIRHPKLGMAAVARILRAAHGSKPLGYELLRRMPPGRGVCQTRMASIGG